MEEENINWDALVNYISGQSSLEEEEMIREWIAMDSKHEEFVVFLKRLWESSAEEKRSWDVDSAWSRFNKEYDLTMGQETSVTESHGRKKDMTFRLIKGSKKRNWISWAAVAASIAIIFVAVFSLDLPIGEEQVASTETTPAYREVVTKNGQRTYLNLSDGSSVILNAGSKLTLPQTFPDTGPRELNLSGEAWFEVEHDPERPFIVYSDDAMTTVLGTKFQVRSYPDDEHVEVVVSEGKVALQDRKKSDDLGATITRNQVGTYFGDGSTSVSRVQDLSPFLGWKDGNLVFEQKPQSQVFRRLERWYDINIQTVPTQPELLKRELTASFTETQPLDEVLETIALTMNIDYHKAEGDSAYLFNDN